MWYITNDHFEVSMEFISGRRTSKTGHKYWFETGHKYWFENEFFYVKRTGGPNTMYPNGMKHWGDGVSLEVQVPL